MVRYQVFGRFFQNLMRVKLDDFLRGIFFLFGELEQNSLFSRDRAMSF